MAHIAQIRIDVAVSLSPDTIRARLSAWFRRLLDRQRPQPVRVLQPIVIQCNTEHAAEAIRIVQAEVEKITRRRPPNGLPRVINVDSGFEGEELG